MARSDWRRPDPASWTAPEGVRRIAARVAYDGRLFAGWQIQKGARTVQQVIQDAASALLGVPVAVLGSGRTDSGVHAMGQVCHFDLPPGCEIPARAFEHLGLPPDVRILEASDAPGTFHARFSTMAREYRYLARPLAELSCFEAGLVAPLRRPLPLDLLNLYAAQVRGTHDFSAFAGSGDLSPSKFRDIYISEFSTVPSPYGGALLSYRICGNAFLYRMVRSLVGTMFALAQNDAPPERFGAILDSRDRSQALTTARPGGLYLWRVVYGEEEQRALEERL